MGPLRYYVMTYLHVLHFITGERMQPVLCVDTHHLSCKEKLLVCARSNVTAEKFANKTSKIPLLTPLLRHKSWSGRKRGNLIRKFLYAMTMLPGKNNAHN